jgi:hypothetical protein
MPYSWTMPQVLPKSLPVLQLSTKNNLNWIKTHVTSAFSESFAISLWVHVQPATDSSVSKKRCSRFLCLQWAEGPFLIKVFLLETPSIGVCCVLFIKHIKLDESYATLAADAYVLVLTVDLIHRYPRQLSDLNEGGAIQVKCSEESYKTWGRYLAASIERCRDWMHTERCSIANRSTHEDEATQPLLRWICNCGAGKVPQEFRDDRRWRPFSPFVVRCLLGPLFPAPLMDHCWKILGMAGMLVSTTKRM